MKLRLELTTSQRQFNKFIGIDLSKQVNKIIKKNLRNAQVILKSRVREWIENQPEIQSLKAEGIPHSLSSLFGLEPGQADIVVNRIVGALEDSIQVNVDKIDINYNGEIEFHFSSDSFASILGLQEGRVSTETGKDLHWLDWLLTKGDTVIILGYHYVPSNSGRSGGGIMIPAGTFRVPPEFSGTQEDNFLTRAFADKEAELVSILRGLFN